MAEPTQEVAVLARMTEPDRRSASTGPTGSIRPLTTVEAVAADDSAVEDALGLIAAVVRDLGVPVPPHPESARLRTHADAPTRSGDTDAIDEYANAAT